MFPHAARFERWLRRRSPHAATPIHHLNDLKLFFAWAGDPPAASTLHDIDAYVPIGGLCSDHCRQISHAMSTINRRLVAIRTFDHFLDTESGEALANLVLPLVTSSARDAVCPAMPKMVCSYFDIQVSSEHNACTSRRVRATARPKISARR